VVGIATALLIRSKTKKHADCWDGL